MNSTRHGNYPEMIQLMLAAAANTVKRLVTAVQLGSFTEAACSWLSQNYLGIVVALANRRGAVVELGQIGPRTCDWLEGGGQ